MIRAFRPDDAEAIAALTLAAIRVTARNAYSSDQVEAWAAGYDGRSLLASAARGDAIRVAAGKDDRPIAYAVLGTGGYLDMLYCHPDHSGRGWGSALLADAEAIARAQGAARLHAHASECARPVFARAGFRLLRRRDLTLPFAGRGVAIHNYAMEKSLV